MTAPEDVLAVMDAAAARLGRAGDTAPSQAERESRYAAKDSLREARATVAELIEVCRKVDVYVDGEAPDDVREEWRAALARVQGATQDPDEDADQTPDDDPPPRHRGWGTLSREERDDITGLED